MYAGTWEPKRGRKNDEFVFMIDTLDLDEAAKMAAAALDGHARVVNIERFDLTRYQYRELMSKRVPILLASGWWLADPVQSPDGITGTRSAKPPRVEL